MSRRTVNIILIAALVLIGGATILVKAIPTERNFEVLPGMLYSVPGDPQTDLLPDRAGNAPLNAVPGSISRGAPLFPSSTSTADSAFPVAMLKNPVSPTDAPALARGAKVFAAFCAPCHGSGGTGDGTVALRGYPPPPSLLAANATAMSDPEMFMIITQGFRNMPSYLSQISEADRWKSVLHVRALQQASVAALAQSADTTAASVTEVKQ